MTDEQKNATTVRSIRASEDVFEKLKEIVSQGKLNNQGEALTALIHLWEIDQAKVLSPDRATEIESFRSTLQRLEEFSINALEINLVAEDRIRQEFAGKLEASAASIVALKKAKGEAEIKYEQLKSDIERYRHIEEENKALREEFTKTISDKDQLNAMLREQLNIEKSKIKELEELVLAGKDGKELLVKTSKELSQQQERYLELQSELEKAAKAHSYELQAKELEFKNQLLESQKDAQDKIGKMQTEFIARLNSMRG